MYQEGGEKFISYFIFSAFDWAGRIWFCPLGHLASYGLIAHIKISFNHKEIPVWSETAQSLSLDVL